MTAPSLTQIAAALRMTTERLAHELATPESTPPAWTPFEWKIARACAALQGVSGLLRGRLLWLGPRDWEHFLSEQHAQGVLRQRRIEEQLAVIDRAMREAGLGVVALKGSALLALQLYAPGTRPMADIDLLGRPSDVETLAATLRAIGYLRGSDAGRHIVFEPVLAAVAQGYGERADNPIRIELHTSLGEVLPVNPIDITSRSWPETHSPGLNSYPSLAALMRHLLLHSAGNMRARAVRLIQLHDIARLAPRLDRNAWRELASDREAWWSWAPLALTERYFPGTIPSFVLAALVSLPPRSLVRATARHELTDVSWSNVHIEAFPGIEWARTRLEAARFAQNRIWPDRSARALLEHTATSVEYGKHQAWYGESQLARIARWVFSRPPRVQTMFSVDAVLGGHEDDTRPRYKSSSSRAV